MRVFDLDQMEVLDAVVVDWAAHLSARNTPSYWVANVATYFYFYYLSMEWETCVSVGGVYSALTNELMCVLLGIAELAVVMMRGVEDCVFSSCCQHLVLARELS